MLETIYLKRNLADPTPLLGLLDRLGLPLSPKAHVTLIHSKTPVDWDLPVFAPEPFCLDVPLLSPRLEAFGPHGEVLALVFDQPILAARNAALEYAGARSDWAPYRPHLTLGPTPVGWADTAHILPDHIALTAEIRRAV